MLTDEEMCREKLEKFISQSDEHIERIEIKRQNELLKDAAIVDTPGLGDSLRDFSEAKFAYIIFYGVYNTFKSRAALEYSRLKKSTDKFDISVRAANKFDKLLTSYSEKCIIKVCILFSERIDMRGIHFSGKNSQSAPC